MSPVHLDFLGFGPVSESKGFEILQEAHNHDARVGDGNAAIIKSKCSYLLY